MSQGARIVVVLGVVAVLGAATFLLMDDAPAGADGQPGAVSRGRAADTADAVGSLPEPVAARPDAVQPTGLAPLQPAAGAAAPSAATDLVARTEPEELLALTGRVIDPLGGPVAGARVVFHGRSAVLLASAPLGTGVTAPERPETRTDADGRFRFEVPLPEPIDAGFGTLARSFTPRLAVVADGFAVLAQECPDLALPASDVGDLELAYGSALHGVVLDEAGRAVAGADVRVRTQLPSTGSGNALLVAISGNTIEQQYTSTQSDSAGRFRVHGLPAGEQALEVVADGMQAGYREDLRTEVGRPLDVGVITLKRGAVIAGVVTDAEGAPLEGASVRVSSLARLIVRDLEESAQPQIGREWQLRATTDAEGRFRLDGLGPGQYTVHARLDGYAPGERENVATGSLDVRLALEPLSGAFVRVLSARDGAPVDDARLQVSPRRGPGVRFVRGRARSTVLTGAEAVAAAGLELAEEPAAGAYFIQGIGPQGVLAEVIAPEFAVHELEVDGASGGVTNHTVSLLPASILAGVVLDGAGEALADARVTVKRYEPPQPGADGFLSFTEDVELNLIGDDDEPLEWKTTRTDSSGRFRFASLPAGDWEVEASASKAAPGEPQVVTLGEGEERTGVVLRLSAAGWIAGRAVEQGGDVIPRADIVAKYLDDEPVTMDLGNAVREEFLADFAGGGDNQRTTTADDAGRFELHGLKPGRWEVSLSGDNGVMMGGAAVFLVAGHGPSDEQTAQVVHVTADTESFVELVRPPQSVLEGKLTAAGEGVEGVNVKLAKANSFLPMGGQSVTTGPGGRFRFEDVSPGAYTVSALVPGAAHREEEDVQLEPGRTTVQDLAFGGVTLRGRVVDAETGDGVEGAKITATPVVQQGSSGLSGFGGVQIVTRFESDDGGGGGFDMTLGGGSTSSVRTDADGRFEVRFLEPGDWSLQSAGGGYTEGSAGPLELTDDKVSDEVVIEVQRAATLFGRVTDGATGLPLDGVPVSVGLIGAGGFGGEITMTEGGNYRVEGLEPGEYRISVMGSGFGGEPLASETAFVKSGEQREVDLTTNP